jgi:hypothetical protein
VREKILAMDSTGQDRGSSASLRVVACVECGTPSSGHWRGWRACRVDDPDASDATPEIGFYCPACADREFGHPTEQ